MHSSESGQTERGGRRRGNAARAGAAALAVGVVLVLAPLLLGRGVLNKYIVASGFLCACVGLSLLLNGLLDRMLPRK